VRQTRWQFLGQKFLVVYIVDFLLKGRRYVLLWNNIPNIWSGGVFKGIDDKTYTLLSIVILTDSIVFAIKLCN
jgi:hypothetical protein